MDHYFLHLLAPNLIASHVFYSLSSLMSFLSLLSPPFVITLWVYLTNQPPILIKPNSIQEIPDLVNIKPRDFYRVKFKKSDGSILEFDSESFPSIKDDPSLVKITITHYTPDSPPEEIILKELHVNYYESNFGASDTEIYLT